MRDYYYDLEERQRRSVLDKERYRNPATRLRKINARRRRDGSPELRSLDEANLRLPMETTQ